MRKGAAETTWAFYGVSRSISMASDRITLEKTIVVVALLIANLVLGPVLWSVGALIALAMIVAERGKLSLDFSSLPRTVLPPLPPGVTSRFAGVKFERDVS